MSMNNLKIELRPNSIAINDRIFYVVNLFERKNELIGFIDFCVNFYKKENNITSELKK